MKGSYGSLLDDSSSGPARSRNASVIVEAFTPPRPDGATLLQTIVTVVKVCIGTGVLALPYTFAQGGIIVSAVMMLVVARWNVSSVNTLLDCEKMVLALESLARKRRRQLGQKPDPPTNESPMSKISWHALGTGGVLLTEWSIGIMMFGVCVSYQVACSNFASADPRIVSFLSGLVPSSLGLSVGTVVTLTTVLPLLPLVNLRDVGFLSRFSALGLLAIALSFLSIILTALLSPSCPFQSLVMHGRSASAPLSDQPLGAAYVYSPPPLFPPDAQSVSHMFGVACFCFGLSPIIFSVKSSMASPREMRQASKAGLTIVSYAYIFLAVLSAYSLNNVGVDHDAKEQGKGECVLQGVILSTLPATSGSALIVRLLMISVCVVSYPLCLIPCSEIIESHLSSSASPPPLLRYVCRSLLLLGTTSVATLIPSFVLAVSLIGCLSIGLATFVLPPLYRARLRKKVEAEKRALISESDKLHVDEYLAELNSDGRGMQGSSPGFEGGFEGNHEAGKGSAADWTMFTVGCAATAFTTYLTIQSIIADLNKGEK